MTKLADLETPIWQCTKRFSPLDKTSSMNRTTSSTWLKRSSSGLSATSTEKYRRCSGKWLGPCEAFTTAVICSWSKTSHVAAASASPRYRSPFPGAAAAVIWLGRFKGSASPKIRGCKLGTSSWHWQKCTTVKLSTESAASVKAATTSFFFSDSTGAPKTKIKGEQLSRRPVFSSSCQHWSNSRLVKPQLARDVGWCWWPWSFLGKFWESALPFFGTNQESTRNILHCKTLLRKQYQRSVISPTTGSSKAPHLWHHWSTLECCHGYAQIVCLPRLCSNQVKAKS